MKILLIQEASKHPENFDFRECLCLQRAFKRRGHICDVLGPGFPQPPKPIPYYEYAIVAENYDRTGWINKLNLKESGLKIIFWSIDPHIVLKRHLETADAIGAELVLCAVKSMVNKFKKNCRRVEWLPNAYPADLIRPLPDVNKSIFLGFCGRTTNRGHWIKALKIKYNLVHDEMVLGMSMVNRVNSYMIHWNRNIGDDINYRTFETMGCGTCLLTNITSGLLDLVCPDEHCIVYNSLEDCSNKIEWLNKDRCAIKQIAEAGLSHAIKKHTYDNRVEIIEQLLQEI